MKKTFLFAVILVMSMLKLQAQEKITPEIVMQKVAKGKPFTLVILKPGLPMPKGSKDNDKLKMDHLVNLFQMEKDGKISVFGPVMNDSTMEGIIVFNSTDKESIKKELSNDPFIKAGYMKFELYNWFTIPGQKIPE